MCGVRRDLYRETGGNMKGMLSVLERAGLIRRQDGEDAPPAQAHAPAVEVAQVEVPAAPVLESVSGMSLQQIYDAAGVPPSAYPAERLVRLLDGLKAMDDGTRMQAIRAIDAADDNWSIADPVNDAMSKVEALEAQARALRASVERAEVETAKSIQGVKQRQEGAVADIRRQILELEGLLAREVARGTEECAAMEAALQVTRDAASRELAALSQTAGMLQALVRQFAPNPSAGA
jgi:hypothetical protein